MVDEINILETERALQLARKGDKAWNNWSGAHPGWLIDFRNCDFTLPENSKITFARFQFSGRAMFQKSKFKQSNNFMQAEFFEDARFDEVCFLDDVFFNGTTFHKAAHFSKAHFGKVCCFVNVTFGGYVQFDNIAVKSNTHFSGSRFSQRSNFESSNFYGDLNFADATFESLVDFDNVTIKLTASFESAVFESEANFEQMKFEGCLDCTNAQFRAAVTLDSTVISGFADFRDAKFLGAVQANGVTFSDAVQFNEVDFAASVNFQNSTFLGDATFEGSAFGAALRLRGTYFATAPDFRATKIANHLSMEEMDIGFENRAIYKLWNAAKQKSEGPRFRRLKQMAANAQNHVLEQEYFAREQTAMRGFEYQGLSVVPSLLYETFSDFGRSLARPVAGLAMIWTLFAILYSVVVVETGNVNSIEEKLVRSSFTYSATQILPLNIALQESKSWARGFLFPDGAPGSVRLLSTIQELLSFIFLFLIGLALRNRFRI